MLIVCHLWNFCFHLGPAGRCWNYMLSVSRYIYTLIGHFIKYTYLVGTLCTSRTTDCSPSVSLHDLFSLLPCSYMVGTPTENYLGGESFSAS